MTKFIAADRLTKSIAQKFKTRFLF